MNPVLTLQTIDDPSDGQGGYISEVLEDASFVLLLVCEDTRLFVSCFTILKDRATFCVTVDDFFDFTIR